MVTGDDGGAIKYAMIKPLVMPLHIVIFVLHLTSIVLISWIPVFYQLLVGIGRTTWIMWR